jgi:predicted HNH restriction endonuclease
MSFGRTRKHSWKIIDHDIVIKKTDKTSFDYYMSVVPIDIRHFFGMDEMVPGDAKEIILYTGDKEILARLTCNPRNPKKHREGDETITEIRWGSNLSNLLRKNFKHYPDFNRDDVPILVFERTDKDYYVVTIKSDSGFYEDESRPEDYRYDSYTSYADGKESKAYVTLYERNPRNREDAINAHGRRCMVCDFDFGENYGSHGVDFIEVHHRVPVSSFEGEMEIDPIQDLVCLCSNCHRMIHRKRNNTLSVEELQEYYDKAQEKKRKNQL